MIYDDTVSTAFKSNGELHKHKYGVLIVLFVKQNNPPQKAHASMCFYSNLKVFIRALVHKVWLNSEICFVSHRVMGRLQQEWPLQLTCSCHGLPIMFISVVKVMGQACL